MINSISDKANMLDSLDPRAGKVEIFSKTQTGDST